MDSVQLRTALVVSPMWAAQGEADIRTVVDTARLTPGTNRFQTILGVVTA